MKILFLCQLMSPLLLTRRNWSPFGYVNSGNLRGSRIVPDANLRDCWWATFLAGGTHLHRERGMRILRPEEVVGCIGGVCGEDSSGD